MLSLKKTILLAALFGLPGTFQTAHAQQTNLWQTQCVGSSRAVESLICVTSQSIRLKENGQLVFKVDIVNPANKGKPEFQLQGPLGIYLPGKIKLSVDGTPISELDVGTCRQQGCYLSTEATPAMVNAMRAGNALQIDFAATADQRQTIDVPLAGFSKAMNDAVQ